MTRIALAILFALTLSGCMVEGYDARTGQRVTEPLTRAQAATRPTTQGGGSIVYVNTRQLDAESAWWITKDVVEKYAPLAGPYGELIGGVVGAAMAGAAGIYHTKKVKKALLTPVMSAAPVTEVVMPVRTNSPG